MFTMIECESCGRSIGAGRLTCPKCGAGLSVHTRITDAWENVEHPVEKFLNVRADISRLLQFGEKISHLSIGDKFIEIQYTNVKDFANKVLHYSDYRNVWSRRTSLWVMECPYRFRFIAEDSDDTSHILIFEIEKWLLKAFDDYDMKVSREKKLREEVEARKVRLERLQEEERLREESLHKQEILREKQRIADEMLVKLQKAYGDGIFSKCRRMIGMKPVGMTVAEYLEIKKIMESVQ